MTESTTAVREENRAWWWAGHVVDLIHMPLVIGLILIGAGIWPGEVYLTIITVLILIQVATLGCPLMYLSGWMKRRYDPSYENRWSFVFWLYHRYGRLAGIGTFSFMLASGLAVRYWLW